MNLMTLLFAALAAPIGLYVVAASASRNPFRFPPFWRTIRNFMGVAALLVLALAPAAHTELILPVRAEVTDVASEDIVATHDSATYMFPARLLGVDASPGDSLLLGVALPNNGLVVEAWKMTQEQAMESAASGTIAADHFIYSQAADSAAKITIVVAEPGTGHRLLVQATRSQLEGFAPGDTASVIVKYRTLVRKTKDGTEARPDHERYEARLVRIAKRQ